MGLLSIFKRAASQPRNEATNETADAVQQARTVARHRLIGAVVLVIIGVIGFPLVFETQPRPIPVDIPIELPRKDGAPALVMPPAKTVATTPAAPATVVNAAPNDVITESREEAGRDAPTAVAPKPRVAAASTESRPEAKVDAKADAKSPVVAATAPKPGADVKVEAKPSAASADGTRARALLEGKPSLDAVDPGRFVVQVGAFADAASAQETRVKVEKLGLKTYTQVASTPAGKRIRVRVGPFGNRDEADRAMAKAKGAGLSAVVLTL